MSLSVTASAANLEIPSRSFSTAIWSSLKWKRNSGSLLMKVFFSMLRLDALAASSFLGTGASELYRSSRRLGCSQSISHVRKYYPESEHTEMVR